MIKGILISFIFYQSILILNSQTAEEILQLFQITSANNQLQDLTNVNTVPSVASLDSAFVNSNNEPLSTFDQFKLNQLMTSPQSAVAANLGRIAGDVFSTLVDLNSGQPRIALTQVPEEFCPFNNMTPPCDITEIYRRPDGGCNNLNNPFWGAANTPYIRILKANYDDGIRVLRSLAQNGSKLPNARDISLNMCNVTNLYFDRQRSHLLSLFGQFIAHDVTSSAPGMDSEGNIVECSCNSPNDDCIRIPFVSTDILNKNGVLCLTMSRTGASVSDSCNLGVRQQLNTNTHTIDLSTIYGVDQDRQNFLREFVNGTLRITVGVNSKEYAPSAAFGSCRGFTLTEPCFTSGDTRVNENLMLSSLHMTFTREHNRLARALKLVNPHWNDEKLFQETRKINTAQFQHIIYNEYLPPLIGPSMVKDFDLSPLKTGYFTGYDDSFKPSIINEFSTSSFRLHTLIRSDFLRFKSDNRVSDKINLAENFFFAAEAWNTGRGGLSSILTGATQQNALLFDTCVNAALRDHLFEDIRNRFDLNAINIMRGRDHGLDTYAAYQRWINGDLNAPPFTSFQDFTNIDPINQDRLASLYTSPEDVDLYIGGISERPLPDAAIGLTTAIIIALQFSNLKIADRFYYEIGDQLHSFTPEQLDTIRNMTISKILCNNVDGVFRIQRSAFHMANFTTNPILLCKDIPDLDLSQWMESPTNDTLTN